MKAINELLRTASHHWPALANALTVLEHRARFTAPALQCPFGAMIHVSVDLSKPLLAVNVTAALEPYFKAEQEQITFQLGIGKKVKIGQHGIEGLPSVE